MKYTFFWTADAFAFVCINLFVLVSGYCLAQTKFKISRLIRLWVETETYSIICVVGCKILGADISSIQVIKALMPFTTESYWFVTAYALLLCATLEYCHQQHESETTQASNCSCCDSLFNYAYFFRVGT